MHLKSNLWLQHSRAEFRSCINQLMFSNTGYTTRIKFEMFIEEFHIQTQKHPSWFYFRFDDQQRHRSYQTCNEMTLVKPIVELSKKRTTAFIYHSFFSHNIQYNHYHTVSS